MRTEITIKPVADADVDELVGVLARAFAHDPMFTWLLGDDDRHVDKLTAIFRNFSGPQRKVAGCDMTTTEDLAGVCSWLGPEEWEPPTRKMLLPLVRTARAIGLGAFGRMLPVFTAVKKHHPKEPHWYLSTLATDPARQRSGVGRALIAPGLARCDQTRLPAYLETQKAENVPYYERFGFVVKEELPVAEDLQLFLMWREPQ